MQAILRWGWVTSMGLALGFGCSSSDDDLQHTSVPGTAFAGEGGVAGDAGAAGAAGRNAVGQATDAAGGSPSTSSGLEVVAGASGACAGEYICPEVAYESSATITVDLPVSVADALESELTACRNGECYSGLGKAEQEKFSWAVTGDGDVQLKFDDSGPTPALRLRWTFFGYTGSTSTPSDHYSLTIEPVGAAIPTMLFDAQVNYIIAPADPTLVTEGYCRHCSEVFEGNVDARANK